MANPSWLMSFESYLKSKLVGSSIRDVPLIRLSNVLHEEVRKCKENSTLSKRFKAEMESCNRERRREIVRRTNCGLSPLFIACSRGCISIVEYLATVCDADIEQKGKFEVYVDSSIHIVTPLWCAAVSNDFPMVKCLLRLGSDINATSEYGLTPVYIACYMIHIEMVKFLVENGANIKKPSRCGTTCLINSVESPELCLFLVQKGCDINAVDTEGKTALHYAIEKHSLETTKLLLEHGANPYAISNHGDDALRTACLKGANQIFDYLRTNLEYSVKRLAEAHELIGATFLENDNDSRMALLHWRLAHHLRSQNPYIEKLPKVPLREAYCFKSEFTTLEELEYIGADMDDMRTQSFLICERILGITHKDIVLRLMFRSTSYANSLQFQRCIHLWILVLDIMVKHNTLLFYKTCVEAQSLVKLMLDLNERSTDLTQSNFAHESLPRFKDVFTVFELLTGTVVECHALLQIRPISRRQQENFDVIFKCIAHTIYLLISNARTPDEERDVYLAVRKLIQANITSACTNDSLLHVCVSRLNVIIFSLLNDSNSNVIFPNAVVIKLLLDCGINVNAKNEVKSTPLHIAAQPYNFNIEIIKILLNHGADLDLPNKSGERPYNLISFNSANTIPLVNYINLKCLAATVISKYSIPYHNQIPKCLEKFVRDHKP